MKRSLMLLAFLTPAVPCMADINITEGSGKVVASESISSKEYQKIKLIDGTAAGTVGAPVDAVGGLSVRLTTTTAVINNYTTNPTTVTQSGTWTVMPGNTPNTNDWRVTMATAAVTGTVTANQGTPGTNDWRVTMATASVTGTVSANQSGTWTVQPGNTANTTDWRVTLATASVTGTVAATQSGTWTTQPGNTANVTDWRVTMATASVTGTVTANQPNAYNTVSTSTYIVNPTTVTTRVLVSSNTALPASTADAGQVQAMGDNKGRVVVVQDVPWANVLYSTAILTTSTAETVFISSPASTAVNILTRCILSNTSATAATITFRSAGNGNNTNSFTIATPPNTVNSPVGFNSPWPQKTFGANWTIQSSASVSSINVSCQYYTYTP